MKWRVLCSLFLIVVKGYSQPEWRTLLDSAKVLWYQDFDKTHLLIDRIEGMIPSSREEFLQERWECKDIRIQSCAAFSRIQLRKVYLDEAEDFLETNKLPLGALFSDFHRDFRLSKAQYLYAIGDYEQALKLFVENQRELQKLPKSEETCEALFYHSNDIAGILVAKGDYEAAINERLAGVRYFECSFPSSPSLLYRNIAQAYFFKSDLGNAFSYLKRADQAVQLQLKVRPQEGYRVAISVYELMASCYSAMGKNDSARLSISRALPLLAYPSVSDEFRGRVHFSLGELYAREEKGKQAMESFKKAEIYFDRAEHRYLSELYTAMASVCHQQGKLQQALAYCAEAMRQVVMDFKPDAFGNPQLSQVRSKKLLFNALVQKAWIEEVASHEQTGTELLQRSLSTNLLAIALLDSISNELSLDQDRMVLSSQSYRAYESGIRLSDKLYHALGDTSYLDRAFALMEKSKSVLLLENLRLVNRFSDVQPEWLERERALKAELLIAEQELYEDKRTDAAALQSVRERYAQLKHTHAQLMEQMKAQAPGYYALRFDRSTVTPEMVQQNLLQPCEALVEFFVGDSLLAVCGFSKSRRYWKAVPLPQNFATHINRLRTLLTRPQGPSAGDELHHLTGEVYQLLLEECITALQADAQRLIIIPDGLLGYIPFEVLQRRRDRASLGAMYKVRYAHSATYLAEQMHPSTRKAEKLFAGFVASSDAHATSNALAALPGALSEVKSIVRELKSGFSLFEKATVTDFKQHASEYTLLHLAMHSLLNDRNPMLSTLVFTPDSTDTDGQMTALELYGIALQAELAVLSACNTGVGELHRGEGLMSFSRAFAYAGVPSLVISLWKVPDKATEKLMTRFYAYLKEGLPKDEALQKARLDFIAHNPDMSHPYFWAGFVLNGNAHPVSFPASVQQYMIFLFSALAIVVLVVYRKKLAIILQRYFSRSA